MLLGKKPNMYVSACVREHMQAGGCPFLHSLAYISKRECLRTHCVCKWNEVDVCLLLYFEFLQV